MEQKQLPKYGTSQKQTKTKEMMTEITTEKKSETMTTLPLPYQEPMV